MEADAPQQLAQEECSGLQNAAAAEDTYLYDLSRKRRKPNFTEPELLTLVELWAQYKTILRGPATDTVMRSMKARVWRKVSKGVMRHGSVIESWVAHENQLRKTYHSVGMISSTMISLHK